MPVVKCIINVSNNFTWFAWIFHASFQNLLVMTWNKFPDSLNYLNKKRFWAWFFFHHEWSSNWRHTSAILCCYEKRNKYFFKMCFYFVSEATPNVHPVILCVRGINKKIVTLALYLCPWGDLRIFTWFRHFVTK